MLAFTVALTVAALASSVWCGLDLLRFGANARRLNPGAIAVAVLLAATVGAAAAIRILFVPEHHAMYLDEPWYVEAACNLTRFGRLVLCEDTWSGTECLPYEKAPGWPILIAPWSLLLGCTTTLGVHLNQGLGSATILLAAIATRCAGGRWWQGLFVGALLAIHPVHAAWSSSGETNVAAAAILLAGLCGALEYLRTGRPSAAALAVCGLGLATAIRPESLAPTLVVAGILAWVAAAAPFQRLSVAAAIAAVGGAAAASGLPLWAMNESISEGAFLSPANIVRNVSAIASGDAVRIHAFVVLLALGGVSALARSEQRRSAWLLFGAGSSAALVALAYDRFDARMLLGATVSLAPLAGLLLDWPARAAAGNRAPPWLGPLTGAVVFLLVAMLWKNALSATATPPETQLLEIRIAARIGTLRLSAGSLVITEQPTILRAAGVARVMRTARALEDEERLAAVVGAGQSVYFLRDMFCEPGFQGVPTPIACKRMDEKFTLTPVAEERLNRRVYGLYRVAPAAPG